MNHQLDHYGAEALSAYGREKQLRMIQEECGELVAEINRFERGRSDLQRLFEEAADVLITISCLRAVAPDVFDVAVMDKLGRALFRLDAHQDGRADEGER